MSGGKEFKQLLDTISNWTGSEPNWVAIMEVVEMLKRKDYSAKKASTDIRKKLLDSKESVILNTMFLVEAIIKNTPSSLHRDFLSPELLGAMKSLVEGQNSSMSRAIDKVLEVLGEWKAAFGEDSSYKSVSNLFNELERGGYYIPEATLASASYIKKGPEFEESDNCYLCDKKFGKLGTRRHHCRNCGKSICGSCEGDKKINLSHLDFDSPQIVCITCYKKLDKSSDSSETPIDRSVPSPQPPPPSSSQPANSQELQLQEEEDIQMAIAISLNEQENKRNKTTSVPSSAPAPVTSFNEAPPTTLPSAPPPSLYSPIYAELDFNQTPPTTQQSTSVPIVPRETAVSEFEQYSSRGQQQRTGTTVSSTTTTATTTGGATAIPQQNESATSSVPLCATLHRLIDQFNQRMQSISDKGLSIATDQAVLSMHQDLTALHMQLLQQIDETQEKKGEQEKVLHKIEEAKEARITFDTMRRRHAEQLLQQEREQQALAQMQVQMKLALLRQQKAEQMAYGQSMQSERLNRLSNQRAEYEKTLATQREAERLKLISLEEQVYQQQFGKGSEMNQVPIETTPYMASSGYTNAPPPPPPSMESYGASYAGPIPSKVDPPPYHGPSHMMTPPPTQLRGPPPTQMSVPPPTQMGVPGPPPTLRVLPPSHMDVPPPTQMSVPGLPATQMSVPGPPPTQMSVPGPPSTQMGVSPPSHTSAPQMMSIPPQPSLYQPPTLYQPPDLAPPPNGGYTPYMASYAPPPSLPVAQPYSDASLYQSNEAPPPQDPSMIQRVPSVPPLISFD